MAITSHTNTGPDTMAMVLILAVLLASLPGCNWGEGRSDAPPPGKRPAITAMAIDNQALARIEKDLIDGMISYLEGSGAHYTMVDVHEVENILNEHYRKLRLIKTKQEAGLLVKKTVTALNRLNHKTDYDLIETDQRELLCAFIIKSGALYGFNNPNEDVTELWRKW